LDGLPPQILNTPTNLSVLPGDNLQLEALVSGSSPIYLQWLFNGTNIANANALTLSVENFSSAKAGTYSLFASNQYGTTSAIIANLSLYEPTCARIHTNLIAWWSGEENAEDIWNSHHGTSSTNVGYADGIVGKAFDLPGSNSVVTVPASPELNVQSLTVEGWIYPRDTLNQQALFEFSSPYNYGLHIWLNMNGSASIPGMLYANLKTSSGFYSDRIITGPAGLIQSTQWTHIALTYDQPSGKAVLYVNGQSVASKNFDTTPARTDLPIHLGSRHGYYGFNGRMDEFALYNRALSSNEVRLIYLAGSQGKCPPEIPPSVISTPQELIVPLGSPLRLAAELRGSKPLSVWWLLNGTNLTTEPTGAEYSISAATFADAGAYSVIVSNAFGVVTGVVANVTVQIMPPSITAEPVSRSVLRGENVEFTVRASGTPPLAYQWYFNGAPLEGATEPSLLLSSVTLAQAGAYQVVVTNDYGAATSAVANLTVRLPDPRLIVQSAAVMGGSVFTVPVLLIANGTENAMQFSISFSPSRLSFEGVEPGASLTNATFLTNLTQLASGRIGLAISLPAEATFAAGAQEVARLTFRASFRTVPISTTLAFGGSPLAQQVANAQAQVLPAQYQNGTVNLLPTEYEGDVAPRGTPDRQLTVIDWVQVGRFVAALDTPAAGTEFQRADCAPRSEGGNGVLSASDWVQAGRYAAGLDSLSILSGPTDYIPEEPPPGLVRQSLNSKAASGNACTVSVSEATLVVGKEVTLPVVLHGSGGESALTFSLQFNPDQLTFVHAQAVAPAGASAVLNMNTAQAGQGRVGFALTLQAGQSYGAGKQEVVLVTFAVKPEVRGPVTLNFASQPVVREVADVQAQPITATTWSGRTLAVALPTPEIRPAAQNGVLTFSWPASLSGVYLEATDDLAHPNWTRVNASPTVVNDQVQLSLPTDVARKFYRLRTEP